MTVPTFPICTDGCSVLEAPFFYRAGACRPGLDGGVVTLVSQSHVPDGVYALVRQHFSEKQLVDLTMAVIAINGWNRLAISFRAVAGSYQTGASDNE